MNNDGSYCCLVDEVHIVAQYVAPKGHNRLQDVEVAINVLPNETTAPFVAHDERLIADAKKAVWEGFVGSLSKHDPVPITGFAVDSIQFRKDQLDWLVETACFRAGEAAAKILIELVRSKPALIEMRRLTQL
jgi:hypothetical protein